MEVRGFICARHNLKDPHDDCMGEYVCLFGHLFSCRGSTASQWLTLLATSSLHHSQKLGWHPQGLVDALLYVTVLSIVDIKHACGTTFTHCRSSQYCARKNTGANLKEDGSTNLVDSAAIHPCVSIRRGHQRLPHSLLRLRGHVIGFYTSLKRSMQKRFQY